MKPIGKILLCSLMAGAGQTSLAADPTAVDDYFSIAADETAAIAIVDVIANDSDADPGDAVEFVYLDDWVNGTASVNLAEGLLYFTPSPGFTGQAQFTYGIQDTSGGMGWAVVYLDVAGGDSSGPPGTSPSITAADDAFTTSRNQVLSLSLQDLFDNDTINGSDQPAELVFIDDWENGVASVDSANQTVSFTPATDFTGTGRFMYAARVENSELTYGWVTITVGNNESPIAVDDQLSTSQNSALTFSFDDLLSNDSDPNNDAFELTYVDDWINGQLQIDVNARQLVFEPEANFVGTASFVYGIEDDLGGMGYASVTIEIESGLSTQAVNDQLSTVVDTPLTISSDTLLANDISSGGALAVTYVDDWINGSVVFDSVNAVLQFTPASGFEGEAQFTYGIEDALGNTDFATVAITVAPESGGGPGGSTLAELFSGQSPMGMNLGGEVFYSPTDYYKDLMRAADPWKTADANGTRWEDDVYFHQIPKRSDGYPTHVPFYVTGETLPQHVETPISAGDRDNTGLYHVRYQGAGEFTIFGATLVEQPAAGHRIYDFGTDPGVEKILVITQSEAGNPLHGISIVHESDVDTVAAQPFNDELPSSLGGTSFVRLMDLMFTNGNAAISDENITPVDYYTWNDCPGTQCNGQQFAGHPPEVLMALVNHLDVHPWLTLPHRADDDFVRAYAEKVYANLEQDKLVILEYSNELWNWLFPQAQWIAQVGCEDAITRVNLDSGECDSETSARRYQTKRSLEMFAIFKDVFGADSDRLITVMAGQGSWAARTQLSMEALNDPLINPNGEGFDAVAIAPYFGGEEFIATQALRDFFVDSDFATLRDHAIAQINGGEVLGGIRDHKQIADQFGAELIAYEGGQHFLCGGAYCDDDVLMTKLAAFQRHDVMEDIYDNYYNTWFAEGGSLFAVFSHVTSADSRFGAWGTIEYYGQPLAETPKLRALNTASTVYQFPGDPSDPQPIPDPDPTPDPIPDPDPTPDPAPTPDPDPTPDPGNDVVTDVPAGQLLSEDAQKLATLTANFTVSSVSASLSAGDTIPEGSSEAA